MAQLRPVQATSDQDDTPFALDSRLAGLLLRCALLGPVAAIVATGFVVVQHEAEAWLWHDLPDRLGMDAPPWWWVVALLLLGSLLTGAALRLPGSGGHSPLDGLAFDVGPRVAASAVAAAFASLTFGAVLGPEAPALAIGTAVGAWAATWRAQPAGASGPAHTGLLMMAGGLAAFGAVLGNPLVVAVFVLEAALLARRPTVGGLTLLPLAVALATGYVVQVGIGGWVGLGEVVLAVPVPDTYPTVLAVDVVLALGLGAVTATVIQVAFAGAGRVRSLARSGRGLRVLVGAGLGTAVLALLGGAVSGEGVDAVLFSGQQALPDLVTTTSVGAVVVILVAKTAAYTLCLGGGFRGGAIFPAVFVGAGVGVLGSLLVASASTTGLVAACIAAATVAAVRLPFSGAMLAVLLMADAGLAVTTPALVGAVVGLLTVLVLERRRDARVVVPNDDGPSERSG